MKKILIFIAILAVASLLLCSCTEYAFTTSSYKKFKSFADSRNSIGLDKQEVLAKLGYPRSFTGADGELNEVDISNKEASKAELLDSGESVWVYECHKYSDPRDPHRLKVTFDSDEKISEITFSIIGGG